MIKISGTVLVMIDDDDDELFVIIPIIGKSTTGIKAPSPYGLFVVRIHVFDDGTAKGQSEP
jgi:hypothetical protein